jgi:predicted AAA+ superfamily ATPase
MPENSSDLGINFEQFIIQEIRAYLSYFRKKKELTYWRSQKYEVDLIIEKDLALEIKLSKSFKNEYTKSLLLLKEEGLIKKFMVVGRFSSRGISDGIEYIPYQEFLKLLWQGSLL